jgi:pimeloyl-ACP methyl ester carboxylesterase
MPKINVNGEEIFYRLHRGEAGQVPLVLAHGAGGNSMHWPGALRRLPAHDVYAVDLPGHGKSGGKGRQSIAAYAEVVANFAAALKLPPFVLGGHSMGGAITQELALRNPECLAALVLVGTGAKLRVAPQILSGILTDYQGTTELVTEWAHSPDTPPGLLPEYTRRLRQVPAEIIHGDYLACDVFDRRADVAQIRHPTLIICGTVDRMTPPKFSQWLKDELLDAELVWVPGAGHMVMLEQPSEVASAVARFLQRLPAGL